MNKRRFYRLPRSLMVKIDCADGQCLGYVNDMAKSGIGIFCDRELPEQSRLAVAMTVAGSPIVLQGQVVWRRAMPVVARTKFQYGVKLAGDLTVYRAFLASQIRHDFELRRHPRYPEVLVVKNGDVLDLLDAAVTNVSVGGLYIRVKRPLAVGDECEMELQNDRLVEPIFCLGEVVEAFLTEADAFAHEYGAGIRIVAFRGDGQARFAEYLKGLENVYAFYWATDKSDADRPAKLPAARHDP